MVASGRLAAVPPNGRLAMRKCIRVLSAGKPTRSPIGQTREAPAYVVGWRAKTSDTGSQQHRVEDVAMLSGPASGEASRI